MPLTFSGTNFEDSLEKFLDKMIQHTYINSGDRESVKSKLTDTLNKLFPGKQIPQNIFTNPLLQKKLIHLTLCAKMENILSKQNNANPKLLAAFNTEKLASAFLLPDNSPEQIASNKLTISTFAATMMLLKPNAKGIKGKADDLADILSKEKQFEQQHNSRSAEMEEEANAKMFAYLLAEFVQTQAFGASSDGTPTVMYIQFDNNNGFPDIVAGVIGPKAGFENRDTNPLSKNSINPEVREEVEEKSLAQGKAPTLNELNTSMEQMVRVEMQPFLSKTSTPTLSAPSGGST